MPRLRRVDRVAPGIRRVRRGRGFSYCSDDGDKVTDPETLQRISDLAVPPAWEDVWICPAPNGHIQAVGTDKAVLRLLGREKATAGPADRAENGLTPR
jgi:DNA topoisomerase IB